MTKGVTAAIGKTEASYRHPRIGEKRQSRKPLRIDKLPAEVKSAIIDARAEGRTWKETAHAASVIAGCTLPPTTVQRWYDLRIEQPRREDIATETSQLKIINLLESILAAVTP
jgi:hypothetical protein